MNCWNICRDTLGNAPKSSWRSFEQYLKGIGDSLGNARRVGGLFNDVYRVVNTVHFGKCPNKSGDQTGAFPTRSPANRMQEDPLGLSPSVSPYFWGISCLFPHSTAILINLIKNWKHNRKYKKPTAILLYFTLSNYTTFGQTNWRDIFFKSSGVRGWMMK